MIKIYKYCCVNLLYFQKLELYYGFGQPLLPGGRQEDLHDGLRSLRSVNKIVVGRAGEPEPVGAGCFWLLGAGAGAGAA